MAKKGKSGRILVKLTSPESNIRYYTEKNTKNSKERLQLVKYASDIRKRVVFREE